MHAGMVSLHASGFQRKKNPINIDAERMQLYEKNNESHGSNYTKVSISEEIKKIVLTLMLW